MAVATDVRRELHQRLLGRVDVQRLRQVPGAERRLRVREEALAILREEGHILPQRSLARVINEVSDAVVGLGPIEFLLKDPDVTEVMVNGPDDVYVERKGRIERVTAAPKRPLCSSTGGHQLPVRTRPITVVPPPGSLRTSSVPPTASRRSAMPCRPVP